MVIGEIAATMAPGGVIGIEREVADRPAGPRTQMLMRAPARRSSRVDRHRRPPFSHCWHLGERC
jgi:hypothetical protein